MISCRDKRAESPSGEDNALIGSLANAVGKAASRQIRVAVFDTGSDNGSATSDLKRLLDAGPACVEESVSPDEIQRGGLNGFDVVIMPGGSGSEQAALLGSDGRSALHEFIRAGGGYVGICGGAFLATAKYDWGLAIVNAKTLTGEIDIPGVGIRSMAMRGGGTVKMELTDAGKIVLGNLQGPLDVAYSGGPILSPAQKVDLPKYVSLALFRTEVWTYQPQEGTMINTPAIIAGRFGEGHVVLFSPHPESTKGLESLVLRAVLATARQHATQVDLREGGRVRRESGVNGTGL